MRVRHTLDTLYQCAFYAGAVLFVSILLLVILQVLSRIIGIVVPGLDDYAGYAVAGSTFLALAGTLRRDGHIRVKLLLQWMPSQQAAIMEAASWLFGLVVCGCATYAFFDFVADSYAFGELGTTVPTPLWIPRLIMAVGMLVFEVALLDGFVTALMAARKLPDVQPITCALTEQGE